MRETRASGENRRLTPRVSTRLGADSLVVEDAFAHLGFSSTPLMILYHVNAGWPVLDETSELLLDQVAAEARDADAEAGRPRLGRYEAPTAGFREQVYRHQVRPAADGTATVALVNRAFGGGQGFGLVIRYDSRTLPSLWQWKMMGEGTYVTGLEPNNAHWHGRVAAREAGVLRHLAPGEVERFRVEIGALADAAAIAAVEREIGRET